MRTRTDRQTPPPLASWRGVAVAVFTLQQRRPLLRQLRLRPPSPTPIGTRREGAESANERARAAAGEGGREEGSREDGWGMEGGEGGRPSVGGDHL